MQIHILVRLFLVQVELSLQVVDAQKLRLKRLREDHDQLPAVGLILRDGHAHELFVVQVGPAFFFTNLLRQRDLKVANGLRVEQVGPGLQV